MPSNNRHSDNTGYGGDSIPITRLLLLLLGGSAAAGGIGVVWLFALRPLIGLGPPALPGLAVMELLAVGLLAGFLVYLQLRHTAFRTTREDLSSTAHRSAEDRLKRVGAIVDRLDHKLNNALMVIRGQAELYLRRDPDGPDSEGLNRIVENADAIKDELEVLGELKQIETESYLGEQPTLTVTEEEKESAENS